jgi:hypothetical protein
MVDEVIVVKMSFAFYRVFVSEGDETRLDCLSW